MNKPKPTKKSKVKPRKVKDEYISSRSPLCLFKKPTMKPITEETLHKDKARTRKREVLMAQDGAELEKEMGESIKIGLGKFSPHEPKENYRVGETINDGDGNEWVITRKYINGEWIDLDLVHRKTATRGDLRVKNTEPVIYPQIHLTLWQRIKSCFSCLKSCCQELRP